MILMLIAIVLILTITFFQSLTGLFSTFVMFVLCLLSAALAFTLYEWLDVKFLAERIPQYGQGVALLGVFLLVLGITRVLADAMFTKNPKFPGLIDRIGGGLFGFLNAIMVVGMLLVGLQLLPFGRELLGFNRFVMFDSSGQRLVYDSRRGGALPVKVRFERKNVLPVAPPDGFVVGLISMLSDAGMSGAESFTDVHPDFLAELQFGRDGTQKEARSTVPPDTVRALAAWTLPGDQLDGGDQLERPADRQWLCIRTVLPGGEEATDKDRRHRLTLRQVRLVGRRPGNGSYEQYTGIGLATEVLEDSPLGNHTAYNPLRPIALPPGAQTVDFVFAVPKDYQPWFLEYKRLGRTLVTKAMLDAGAPKPKVIAAVPPPTEADLLEAGADEDDEGVLGNYVRQGWGRFDRNLPCEFEPEWFPENTVAIQDNRVVMGHTNATWPMAEAERAIAVTSFAVPQNYELYQLSITVDDAKSIFGRALQFARNVVAQPRVRDDRGEFYFRAGEIRIANVGPERRVEIQYWPRCATGEDQTTMVERCIREATTIPDDQLKDNYALIYLFLIKDGRTPVEFDMGNRIRKLQ